MTELQGQEASPAVEDQVNQPVSETTQTGSDSAPDSGEDREQNTSEQSPEDEQDKVQKRINKMHWEKMEAKREAAKYQKELEELRKAQEKPLQDVDVPPMPDVWDDDFDSKIKARDAAIRQNERIAAQREVSDRITEQQRKETERKRSEEAEKLGASFNERAKKLAINEHSLNEAQKLLINNGLGDRPELAQMLLTDEDGPAICMYLAENPLALDSFVSADVIQAVRMVDREFRLKIAQKPKAPTAPPPPETLNGKGAAPVDAWKQRHPNAVIE